MACNCKQTAKSAEKYTNDTTLVQLKGFAKVAFILRKIITILLVIFLFIVGTPFALLYGILRIITGKGLHINISKIIKVFNVKQ